jgi:uncharacterized protein
VNLPGRTPVSEVRRYGPSEFATTEPSGTVVQVEMDDSNPFIFNRPVGPEDLVDREGEARSLLDLAEGGHAVRLSAPRRYGKTSLLRRVARDAENAGMEYVEVDFYGVLTHAEIVARIEESYAGLRSPARRMAIAAIRALRPRVSVGGGPIPAKVEAAPQPSEETTRVLTGLLDLPVTLFERTGRRTLVAFDEFQSLLAVDPRIDGLFRSRIQRHGDAASYIFAGSHPGLMEQLFGTRERPLFGQARALRLDPLPDSDLADYIGARFEAGRRDAAPVLGALLDLVAGHPQRAMLLAHHLWEQTPRGEAATPEAWERAQEEMFAEHGEALQATWDALEAKERAVLTAVAIGADSLFNQRTLARFNLSKGGAGHARDSLLHAGHLQGTGSRLQAVDPLMTEWIRRLNDRRALG